MPKSKGTSEHKSNASNTDGKNSTCREIHPTYTHGNGGCIKNNPYNALYCCPESREVPNIIYGAEFQIHIKMCFFCYY